MTTGFSSLQIPLEKWTPRLTHPTFLDEDCGLEWFCTHTASLSSVHMDTQQDGEATPWFHFFWENDLQLSGPTLAIGQEEVLLQGVVLFWWAGVLFAFYFLRYNILE